MARCGLCLGPLGFRLHCILLNECGLYIISADWVRLVFPAGPLFTSPGILGLCAGVSHIFLDFGEVETSHGRYRRNRAALQIISAVRWGLESKGIMDVLALEAKSVQAAEPEKKAAPRPKPKPPKKAKRIVYFEVEIIDLKTKEKLLLLDKVSVCTDVLITDILHWKKKINISGGYLSLRGTQRARMCGKQSHFITSKWVHFWIPKRRSQRRHFS